MTRQEILVAIEEVNWRRYETWMGNWREIPAALRVLLGQKPEVTRFGRWLRMVRRLPLSNPEQAIDALANELEHQGGPSEAAFPAIPLLANILSFLDVPEQVGVTNLLVSIALPFADGLELFVESGWWDPNYYRLLESYAECFLPLLDSEDTKIDGCFALAWFPRVARDVLPRLREISANGSEEERVTALMARGLVGDEIGVLPQNSGRRLRRVSALASAYSHGLCAETLEVFVEMSAWQTTSESWRATEWMGPWDCHLIQPAGRLLQRTEPSIRSEFLKRAEDGPLAELAASPLDPKQPASLRPWLTISGVAGQSQNLSL